MVIYVQKFAFPAEGSGRTKHQAEHQAGLELLRMGLAREYGLDLPSLTEEISAGFKGKPFLRNYPEIFFNISHGGNMAACGLDCRPLGIDIEEIRPVKKRVGERILTQREKQYLESTDPAAADREFFRIWTLKESCAKAFGLGLAMDFTRIECVSALETTEFAAQEDKLKNIRKIVKVYSREEGSEISKETVRMAEVTVHLLTEGWKQELSQAYGKDEINNWKFLETTEEGGWQFFQAVLENRYVLSCCCKSDG